MTAGEFCTREVVIAEKESDIIEVARLMRNYHVGDVIVVEQREALTIPVGIITDRDLVVELLAQQVQPAAVTAGDLMSRDLLTAGETEGIWDVMRRMRGRGIRRVPVVNARGGLVGILAVDDLIDLLAEELTLLARIAVSGRQREEEKLG